MNKGRVFRRGNTWYVDCYAHGDRVRKAAGSSKWDALRLLKELQHAEVEGHPYVALGDVFQAYVTSLRTRAKRTSIEFVEIHKKTLEAHFEPVHDAGALTRLELDAFVAARLDAGRSRASVNGSLRVLRAALRYGVEINLLARMPLQVRKLREGKRLPRVLEPDQIDALARAAPSPFDVMILLAAHAGLRHREILYLQMMDVVLDGAASEVRVTAKPGWTPKNHHERAVPIDPGGPLASRLEEHIRNLERMSSRAWLFPGQGGKPRYSAFGPIREAFKAAGLYDPELKPGLHALRRTWATRCLGKVDIETVRQLGGWADLVTVQRYVTTIDERKRAAVARLYDG